MSDRALAAALTVVVKSTVFRASRNSALIGRKRKRGRLNERK